MLKSSSVTSFPHGSPSCDVALCILQEVVHWWGETDGLDGVGDGGWDCQLQQSYVKVHVGAIEGWVDDDPLDGDDQGSYPRTQHRSQAHSPVSGIRITECVGFQRRLFQISTMLGFLCLSFNLCSFSK